MTSKDIKEYKELMNNIRPLLTSKTSDDFIDKVKAKVKEIEDARKEQ